MAFDYKKEYKEFYLPSKKPVIVDVPAMNYLVLVGNGAILLGIFNLIFFPCYFKKPDKIGVPFVIGAVVIFLLISVFIVLRWATPLYSITLNGLNSENTGAKIVALAIGIAVYVALSAISCKLSMKNFQKIDV